MPNRVTVDLPKSSINGPRYNIPKLLHSDVLSRPRLIADLDAISADTGRPREKLDREALRCLREMAATPSRIGLDIEAAASRYIYTSAFDREIEFAPSNLDRIREVAPFL